VLDFKLPPQSSREMRSSGSLAEISGNFLTAFRGLEKTFFIVEA
jgi:hypothetical protein